MFLKDIIPINETFFMWDAIVAWRDSIFQTYSWNTTKSNYVLNMQRLIEAGIVNVQMELNKTDEAWLEESKKKIDALTEWAPETKSVRKSTLNSLYKFIQNDFDRQTIPYQRHPKPEEIKHILSSVKDKTLTQIISPITLCEALCKINERDAYIVWLMMHTGKKLEAILDVRKTKEEYRPPYMLFNGQGEHVPKHITEAIDTLCKNSTVYLFETSCGKRITRTQVTRNLKQAGRRIGLTFDLTPKILHGYVMAYMSADKRSDLQKAFSP